MTQDRATTSTTTYFVPGYQTAGKLAIVPPIDEHADSLELSHFKSKLSNHLSNLGYAVVDDPSTARYFAEFEYSIDDGTEKSDTTIGINQTGGGTATSTGTVIGASRAATVSGTATSTPTYEFNEVDLGTITVYGRSIELRIVESVPAANGKRKPILKLIAHSKSSCRNLTEVVDEIIEAIFVELPGKNDKTRWHSVKAESVCWD